MSLKATVIFKTAGEPVKWEDAAAGFSKVLSNFASRNFDTYSLDQAVVKFTATTISKTRKEVARMFSSASVQWQKGSKVKNVVIIREYNEQPVEPAQAASSSDSPPAPQEAPKWAPMARWRRAAEQHFAPTPKKKLKGIIMDVSAPTSKWLANNYIAKHSLVLFPPLPDSSARLVPSYPGHPDAARAKWSTIPRKLHKLAMIGARAGALAGYAAAVQAGIDMGIVDEDYESYEEAELCAQGHTQAAARSETLAKRRRNALEEVQRARIKKAAEERKTRSC